MSDDPLEDYYAQFQPSGKASYDHDEYRLATDKITLGEFTKIREMQQNGVAESSTRRPIPLSILAAPRQALN